MSINVVIEKYEATNKIVDNKFYLPAIPWKWTIYDGSKVIRYGYAHTEEQAKEAIDGALKSFNN
jgi:hypothetical protein